MNVSYGYNLFARRIYVQLVPPFWEYPSFKDTFSSFQASKLLNFLVWRKGVKFHINRSGTKTSNFKQISSPSWIFRNSQPIGSQSRLDFNPSEMEKIKALTSENGVVIFTKSTCCLCYAVTILFQELRVNPLVHEIDQDPEGREMEKALLKQGCNSPPVPAVYIGGKLVGSTNEVMSLHLSGSLIPLLKSYQSL
ncbi:hypothetical protein L2E82_00072 [Cichorium intybus]|uniref:Uncharacterized protein n=1 Tax=Cichorium intybus TaxID=13427 RepID=A0ACB9GX95_CICIN|nr:hypothetical protein L2E82_00072 [Cichorium intybus]